MLTTGNEKLGPGIFSWSIPAALTCPGASPVCLNTCYALRSRFRMNPVLSAHKRNLLFAHTTDFVPVLIKKINKLVGATVRIHVAGDFFSDWYAENWLEIIKACRRVSFFAYTRSWSVPAVLPTLLNIARQPNMQLWWSVDSSMGRPPAVSGVRVAYEAINDLDAAHVPPYCDLVFRNNPKTIMKKANGVQVCPVESGIAQVAETMTCTKCRICYRRDAVSMSDLIYAAVTTELSFDEEDQECAAPLRLNTRSPVKLLDIIRKQGAFSPSTRTATACG